MTDSVEQDSLLSQSWCHQIFTIVGGGVVDTCCQGNKKLAL